MGRLVLGVVAVLTLQANASLAQSPPKPTSRSVDSVQADCIKVSGERIWCDRVAEQARSRYGNAVTGRQWQSSAGVVRARAAQGKYN